MEPEALMKSRKETSILIKACDYLIRQVMSIKTGPPSEEQPFVTPPPSVAETQSSTGWITRYRLPASNLIVAWLSSVGSRHSRVNISCVIERSSGCTGMSFDGTKSRCIPEHVTRRRTWGTSVQGRTIERRTVEGVNMKGGSVPVGARNPFLDKHRTIGLR